MIYFDFNAFFIQWRDIMNFSVIEKTFQLFCGNDNHFYNVRNVQSIRFCNMLTSN